MLDPQEFLYTFIDNQSIELVSVIGSGSYGVVYLGRYVYSNRYYAVKCVADNNITRNEVDMHSILSGHPNILALEKVLKERNHIFIVMEYATHGDLFSSITQPQLSQEIIGKTKVIRHLFLQVLDAVQHCHHNLIAHRDLKPENILLLSNHRIKLADFGLTTSQIVSKEFNCGSSFYFSPECQGITAYNNTSDNSAKMKPVQYYDTLANDIWSLGIILINLVSGRSPWKVANLQDPAFAAYVRHPRRFFRTILPGISKGFDRILIRIFCLNPSKRITLHELRNMILSCRSFTNYSAEEAQQCNAIINKNMSRPISPPPSPQQGPTFGLECSESFASTMIAYIGDYTDNEEENEEEFMERVSNQPSLTQHQNKSSSSNSSLSIATAEGPPTPRHDSPVSNFHFYLPQQKQYEQNYIKHYDF